MIPQPDLDAALLAAHAADDRAGLVTLYETAAHGAPAEAQSFFLTQAYVFALETGHPRAAPLRAALVARGAETP
ncbi:hypothetical protein GLS40_05610 [Pseudooceanicola sp. 216_PA32_1]|uniref:Uncharacterized protein n=1 Tax=Pseudooceanicola pacificus TaxID=2676438 RepID=A0A844W335_9RHOB|nr:hypothetical protein [Pseudooceanicola pacificus]MWB77495.1 hypothetical protein [Pseudooceanicola pacificus]